jgi:hypothetical protein
MKNTLMNTRTLAIALATTFSVAIASPTLANDEKKAIPVELKFLGNIENKPVFQLTFNSPVETEFTVVVRDKYNNVFYKENVKGGNISKKFLLNIEELGDDAIQFEITGRKTDKTVIYDVNKKSRVIEDLIISKRS